VLKAISPARKSHAKKAVRHLRSALTTVQSVQWRTVARARSLNDPRGFFGSKLW
jgi:hypothetical protein